jgi:hypothetical protein
MQYFSPSQWIVPERVARQRSLGEQEISDLFSSELSEVPLGSDSDTDSGGD